MHHLLRALPSLPARRLTALYILALSSVAVLTILSQLLVQHALVQQSSDARVINIAGRQRMLSQRISKAALALHGATAADERHARGAELEQALTLWERSHRGLQRGDAEFGLPGANSVAVMAMFEQIEPAHQVIRSAARAITGAAGASGGPTDEPRIKAALAQMLAAEPSFLTGMDQIVFQYDREATARVEQLKGLELGVLVITLGVLLLEGFFVFRPAARQIQGAIDHLLQAQAQLEHAHAEQVRSGQERLALQEQVIAAHQTAFAMSAPLLPITDEVVVMPLVGSIDEARSQLITNSLLQGLRQSRGRITIIDLTGVASVDQATAGLLARLASAARLLGVAVVVTGIRAEVARTLIAMKLPLDEITFRHSLQDGVRAALASTSPIASAV